MAGSTQMWNRVTAIAVTLILAITYGYITTIAPVPEHPIKLHLYTPTVTVAGYEYHFYLEPDGKIGRPQWNLIPSIPGALTISSDGLKAHFRTVEVGEYTITVSAAGKGLVVVSEAAQFENLAESQIGPLDPQPAPVMPPASQSQIPTIISNALNLVHSDNYQDELKKVNSCIISAIKQIETGKLATSTDIVANIRDQVRLTLEDNAEPWMPLIDTVDAILEVYRSNGQITDVTTTVPVLSEISRSLK